MVTRATADEETLPDINDFSIAVLQNNNVQPLPVELDKLHVLHGAFGAVDHGDAVARGHQRVGGVAY